MNEAERLDRVTEAIIGAAMGVHRALGPGLLESAYEACLAFDVAERGVSVRRGVCRLVNDFPDSRRSPRPRR